MYQYGETLAAKTAREAEQRARQKVAELNRLNAELETRIEHRKQQLRRVPKVRPYTPTPEQLAYRDQNPLPTQPEPKWGGQHNLYLASLEAAQWDQTHRRGKAA